MVVGDKTRRHRETVREMGLLYRDRNNNNLLVVVVRQHI